MTSQISMRKLIKLEMKQSSWMLALSALGQFMAGPVLYLLSINTYLDRPERAISMHCGFFSSGYFMAQLFMMILAICFTIFSYRYLFSKRMVDLYHSVPITRTKLFFVKYIHGFLIWFLPFIVFGITIPLLSFIRLHSILTWNYAGTILLAYLQSALLLIICFFIFYHLYLVAVYLSGNVLNMFTNVAIMGFTIVCIYGLFLACASQFLDTYCTNAPEVLTDLFYALSPFTAPFCIFSYLEMDGLMALLSQHPILMVVSILLSVSMLLLSLRLYLKRPSELAERGTINKWYMLPAKLIATFMISIALSIFFGEFIYGSSGLFWGIFGAILGGILTFGALNSIFHTTIKAFFKHKIQMFLVTLAGVLSIMAFQMDWFGYDEYLPNKNDIAGMAIYLYRYTDDSTSIIPETYGFSYSEENQRVLQKELLTDKDICYDFLKLAVKSEETTDLPYEENYFTFYAKVALENGRTYYRSYKLPQSQYLAMKPFIETEEYKNTNYKLSAGLLGYPDQMEIYLEDAQMTMKLTPDQITKVMDAFWADFEDHYTIEELSSYLYSINLELTYEGGPNNSTFYSRLCVPDSYTRTVEYFQSLYSDYIPYITSSDQIMSLTPYLSANTMARYGGLYGYFGMEGYETGNVNSQITEPYLEEMVVVEDYYYGKTYSYDSEFVITDPKLIDRIYPYLYFGQYRDFNDSRNYIYFADVRTVNNHYTQCYVKPDTLPEDILKLLEEQIIPETY
ncbi:MAG: hypothetical protein IJ282_06910 [Lachnospiraceae bacterium]|nr:hypothetical protein [Lachnospiraceae bacterium]